MAMVIRGFSETAVLIHRVMDITMAVALTAAGMAGMVAVVMVEADIDLKFGLPDIQKL